MQVGNYIDNYPSKFLDKIQIIKVRLSSQLIKKVTTFHNFLIFAEKRKFFAIIVFLHM